MVEKEKKDQNKTLYVLIVLLVVASFTIGYLFNKVKTLEKTGSSEDKKVPGTQQAGPTAPPKAEVKITDDDPSMGPKDAKVTLAIFSDFLCPFCAAYSGESKEMVKTMQSRDNSWQPPLTNIIKDYVKNGKVRLVWKDLPFHGDEAIAVHAAAHCAFDQNKFWEYHDRLFAQHDAKDTTLFNKDNLKKSAASLGLNTKDFNSCVDSGKYIKKMQESISYGQSVGVDGTPATFVNGKLLSGAMPYSQFKTIIEEELKK